MQPYDIAMLAVLVLATALGAYKGMAWQVASLASLVCSYLVALKFREPLAPLFGQQAPLNGFIAMLVLYVGTSLAIWVAFRMVAGVIDRVKLREFDHQLGALLGLAKGVLLCAAITFFAVTLSASLRETVMQSRSGYYIAVLMDRAHAIMPDELHDLLEPYIHQLDERLGPDHPPHHEAAPQLGTGNWGGASDRDGRRPEVDVLDQADDWLREARDLRDTFHRSADELRHQADELRHQAEDVHRKATAD